jgi:hypothetical protein
MNLARPFQGRDRNSNTIFSSRQRRLTFQPSPCDEEFLGGPVIPALRGWAKFKRRYATKEEGDAQTYQTGPLPPGITFGFSYHYFNSRRNIR